MYNFEPSDTIRNAVSGTFAVVDRFPSSIPPWKRFLLLNPQLSNGGLFLHYYSKQRMLMDPDARCARFMMHFMSEVLS